MSGFALPEGWTSERLHPKSDRYVVISAPGIGHVTVDFECRCYRGGMTMTGSHAEGSKRGTAGYRGRNWRVSLVLDAVDYLKQRRGARGAAR